MAEERVFDLGQVHVGIDQRLRKIYCVSDLRPLLEFILYFFLSEATGLFRRFSGEESPAAFVHSGLIELLVYFEAHDF